MHTHVLRPERLRFGVKKISRDHTKTHLYCWLHILCIGYLNNHARKSLETMSTNIIGTCKWSMCPNIYQRPDCNSHLFDYCSDHLHSIQSHCSIKQYMFLWAPAKWETRTVVDCHWRDIYSGRDCGVVRISLNSNANHARVSYILMRITLIC